MKKTSHIGKTMSNIKKKVAQISQKTSSWTYLTNHTHVLVCLNADEEMRVRDLAQKIGITERAVQKILGDLEEAKVIARVKEGRRNRYTMKKDALLRHPLEKFCTIGGLLHWIKAQEK